MSDALTQDEVCRLAEAAGVEDHMAETGYCDIEHRYWYRRYEGQQWQRWLLPPLRDLIAAALERVTVTQLNGVDFALLKLEMEDWFSVNVRPTQALLVPPETVARAILEVIGGDDEFR